MAGYRNLPQGAANLSGLRAEATRARPSRQLSGIFTTHVSRLFVSVILNLIFSVKGSHLLHEARAISGALFYPILWDSESSYDCGVSEERTLLKRTFVCLI